MTFAIIHGIGPILVQAKLLNQEQARDLSILAQAENLSLLQYVIRHNLLSASIIAQTIAWHFGLPLFDLDSFDTSTLVQTNLSHEIILKTRMLPLFQKASNLYVATDDPSNHALIKEVQFHIGLPCKLLIVAGDKLQSILNSLLAAQLIDDLNHFIQDASDYAASDIHIEPYEHYVRIRYRLDGVLHEVVKLPLSNAVRLIAQIKVLAQLDIAEKRLPQDGSFKIRGSAGQAIELRVSSCPTIYGMEKLVLRIHQSNRQLMHLDALGLNPNQLQQVQQALAYTQGMILVTGPTGSGKTLSLYSAIQYLNHIQLNISTIEDPVEMNIPGINQVAVNPKAGLTFAKALRALLRQDPDIIMLGEIRDLETAEIAIQASQTGHLLLSTVHSNSAIDTINRLLHLGISAFDIASSIRLIIAQRLVRKLCQLCQHQGCKHCTKGYKGRIGIFEIVVMTKELRQALICGSTMETTPGFISLYDAGLEKVRQGITSMEELHRVVGQ